MDAKKSANDTFRVAFDYLRRLKKIELEPIASLCGCSKRHIQAILSPRERKGATRDLAEKIATALGSSYGEMMSLGGWILSGKDPYEWRMPEITAAIGVCSSGQQIASVAAISPVNVEDPSPNKEEDDHTTISEALVMTENVLKSKTVYRSVLMSNIKAFNKAVMGETEMEKMNEKIDRLERMMEQKMNEIMRLVSGDIVPKRETKTA